MLDNQIFEYIRSEFKKIYSFIQDDKLDNQKKSDYLFYKNNKSCEIESIIDLLKSNNISLSIENSDKLNNAIALLNEISKELNEKKEISKTQQIKAEQNERLYLNLRVKDTLKLHHALFPCENLKCVHITPMSITEPDLLFNFLHKNEMFYSVKGGNIRVYKNTTEDIKEKIFNFLKKDFENHLNENENLTHTLEQKLIFEPEIQWEDIVNYCENMNKTVFIN